MFDIIIGLCSIFVLVMIWTFIDLHFESKNQDYVRRALTKCSSGFDPEYIVKYAQNLMKSINIDCVQNLFLCNQDLLSCNEFSGNYALNRALQALTLPDCISDRQLFKKYHADYALIQTDIIHFIDQVKVAITNSHTKDSAEIETAKKDFLLFILTVIELSYANSVFCIELNYANSVFCITDPNSCTANIQIKKLSNQSQMQNESSSELFTPEEWIRKFQKHEENTGHIDSSELSDMRYEDLLRDLHRLDKYFKNFQELRFSDVQNIVIAIS